MEAQPSRTAMRVALRRAAHQSVDAAPLVFPDRFAIPIVGKAAIELLRRTPQAERKPFSAAMRAWVVARSRVAEDALHASALKHTSLQYLVLGAGLDTFCLRNPYAHVQVFEVDHPLTQAWKRERLSEAELAPRPHTHLVSVDFETQSLQQQLELAGFQKALPTVTAWLGVVPYLTREAFTSTCRFLGRLAPGSAVLFDYSQPRAVLPPVEQLMHDSLAARVAQVGEPFRLFFTPAKLAAELETHGLQVTQDLDSAALNRRFFTGRSDGLHVRGSAGRLCHAVVS